jgi:3,4-dihydroxy-9,10-secoandrosta-1,3,5(10)-triene-9,17-dione 4,5-dioxygenase
MSVRSLAYIRVQSCDLSAWRHFAENIVGASTSLHNDDQTLLVRIDARPWRFRIEQGDTERYVCAGLECKGEADYLAVLDRVRSSGVAITEGDAAATRERHMQAFASFDDPAGNGMSCFQPKNIRRRAPVTRICLALATVTKCAFIFQEPQIRDWG